MYKTFLDNFTIAKSTKQIISWLFLNFWLDPQFTIS